ncbi:MAG: hypothetical protein JXR64_13210 [Spirochaetales bacterium]|nr:hypothetical protein [Spirochaetales bacterium]
MMMISTLRDYIKEQGSTTMSELNVKFNLTSDELEGPINILISKNLIKPELPTPVESTSKCSGCPMGCSSKEQENCSPAPIFTIYKWIA